jgi:hypothetical protein
MAAAIYAAATGTTIPQEEPPATVGSKLPGSRLPRMPNTDKWIAEGGTVTAHPDGSITYTNSKGVSVTYSKEDYPDFSPYAKAEVKVKGLTGNYKIDEEMANKALGLKQTPPGLTWHHHEDGRTMQLVPSEINNSFPHTGGASKRRGR